MLVLLTFSGGYTDFSYIRRANQFHVIGDVLVVIPKVYKNSASVSIYGTNDQDNLKVTVDYSTMGKKEERFCLNRNYIC